MPKTVIDENVRHGKPVIKGTRITGDVVLGMLEGGMTYEEIEEEYGLTTEQIKAVIEHAASMVRGEEVRDVPA